MARQRNKTRSALTESAMEIFWRQGYWACSMADLVHAIGTTRHSIYGDFGGKEQLYLACFEVYQQQIVAPALRQLEQPNAGLDQLADYFYFQIDLADSLGLPGPGCLVNNATTETAPHNPQVRAAIDRHHQRLHGAFRRALEHEQANLPASVLDQLAQFIVIWTQGLWSVSRVTEDAAILRQQVALLIKLLAAQLRP